MFIISKYFLLRLFVVALSLAQIKLMTYLLTTEDVAIILFLTAILQFSSIFGASAFGNYASREWHEACQKNEERQLFFGTISSATIAQSLIGFFIIIYLQYFQSAQLEYPNYLLIIILSFLVLSCHIKLIGFLLNITKNTNAFMKVELLNALMNMVIPVCFVILIDKTITSWLLGYLAASVFCFLYSKKNIETKCLPSKSVNKSFYLKSILKINSLKNYKKIFLPMSFLAFAGWIELHFYKLLLSHSVTLEFLGVILVYQRIISQFLNNFNTVISTYLSPKIYHLIYEKSYEKVSMLLLIYALLLISIGVITFLVAPQLVNIIANSEYNLDSEYIFLMTTLVTLSLIIKLSSFYFQLHKRFDIAIRPTIYSLVFYIACVSLHIIMELPEMFIFISSILMLIVRGIIYFFVINNLQSSGNN